MGKDKLKKRLMKATILSAIVILVMAFLSCAVETSGDEASSNERTMSGGNVRISIYLLHTPKTVEYTPGVANNEDGRVHAGCVVVDPSTTKITRAFLPSVWAWKKKSSGDVNYSNAAWPGEEAMTPYDNNDQEIKFTVDDNGKSDDIDTNRIAYWKLDMKADPAGDLGILFVDTKSVTVSSGNQIKWEQTNDVTVPKSLIKKNAKFYFVYKKSAYYTSEEAAQGLLGASITSADCTKVEVTYIKGVTLTSSNFYSFTDNSNPPQNITVTDIGDPTTESEESTQVKSILTVTCTNPKPPFRIIYVPTGYELKKDDSGNVIKDAKGDPEGFDPVYANYSEEVIDKAGDGFCYSGDDLGLTFGGDGSVTFKMWSPTAQSVDVVLFKTVDSCGKKSDNPDRWSKIPSESECKTVAMTLNTTTHAWEKEVSKADLSGYEYYKYRLRFSDKVPTQSDKEYVNNPSVCVGGVKWLNTIECVRKGVSDGTAYTTFDVSDIWSKITVPDSVASVICNIDDDTRLNNGNWELEYTNPWAPDASVTKKYSEAVLYEVNIADLGEGCKGKFNELTASDFIDHIKDLGITHVCLMPITDNIYTNVDTRYNWGFCAYHFNAIESRYVVGADTGLEGVLQLRALVKALHQAGVAVIMDVDFAHTGNKKVIGGSQSLYDSTVPHYFYRMVNGEYSNGANQGTELAVGRTMVKKYIINSLKHWMNDFHINGFSFYLMGLAESSVMSDIYNALKVIDPSVIIFGEGWTGGRDNAVGDKGTTKAIKIGDNGVATLDESFRTAIKGKELRGFTRGLVQGNFKGTLYDNNALVIKGLKGIDDETDSDGKLTGHNDSGTPHLSIHYAETHDDNTLFDKLLLSRAVDAGRGSYSENTVPLYADLYNDLAKHIDLIKKEDTLAAAMVILAQGTPFISCAQEFLRTKKGNQDSSEAGRLREQTWNEKSLASCNKIDLSMADTYNDIFCAYRGLIALRRENPTAFGSNKDAIATALKDGVIKYETGGYTIFFNGTDSDYPINVEGYLIDTSGAIVNTGFDSIMRHEFVSAVRAYTQSTQKRQVQTVGAKGFVIIKN